MAQGGRSQTQVVVRDPRAAAAPSRNRHRWAPTKRYCYFCGRALTTARASRRLVCRGCRASFLIEEDRAGCTVRLRVVNCGAQQCCRSHRNFAA